MTSGSARYNALRILSWGYLLLMIIMLTVIYTLGDRWWPVTLILFGPRWVLLFPLIVLFPLAILNSYRLFLPLLVSLFIVLVPVMGFNISIGKAFSSNQETLRVITCNLQVGDVDEHALETLIQKQKVDIVALQECPGDIKKSFLHKWFSVQEGELAVFSRYPLMRGQTFLAFHPQHKWPRVSLLQCTVQAPGCDVTFCTVHLPSPRYGLQTILDKNTFISLSRKGRIVEETKHRRQISQAIRQIVSTLPQPVIIAGDFNMPVDSTIYRNSWGEYTNAFSKAGLGYGLTCYQIFRGLKNGMRIDHVLVGEDIDVLSCKTGPVIGSDHLPLITEMGCVRRMNH